MSGALYNHLVFQSVEYNGEPARSNRGVSRVPVPPFAAHRPALQQPLPLLPQQPAVLFAQLPRIGPACAMKARCCTECRMAAAGLADRKLRPPAPPAEYPKLPSTILAGKLCQVCCEKTGQPKRERAPAEGALQCRVQQREGGGAGGSGRGWRRAVAHFSTTDQTVGDGLPNAGRILHSEMHCSDGMARAVCCACWSPDLCSHVAAHWLPCS
jgi:hypothetical protein